MRGLRLSVLERPRAAPATAAPLLILHGMVSESESYRKFMRALPADRRVLALDMPGSGYSERPSRRNSTFREMAACVRDLIAALGLEHPIVIAHSHGGAIALLLAVHQPEQLSALILMAPAHPYSGVEAPVVRFYLSRPGRMFAHLLPHLPDQIMLAGFRRMPGSRSSMQMEDIAPYLHTLRVPGTVAHILRMVESWHEDMAELRTGLDAHPPALPALLLWGERDIVVPARTAAGLLSRLPAAKLTTLPGIGHVPNEEAPQQTAALITEWLNSRGL